MNEEGNFYIGTNVYDLKSGEQFSIPLKADNELGNVTNQVLNNVIIKGTLFMNDDSIMRFGPNTTLIFNSGTELRTDLGPIQAGTTVPDVYATTDRAGFVELASDAEIRGAFGSSNTGIADKVVVTAQSLATELDIRLNNSVQGAGAITVSQQSIEAGGGADDDDDSNNIIQFSVQLGLDANNQNPANLAGLRLGSTTGQLVTSITNSVNKSANAAVQQAQLVTARALRLYQIDTDQLVDDSVTAAKLKDSASVNSDRAVTTNHIRNSAITSEKIDGQAVIESKIANNAVSTNKIQNDAVNEDKLDIPAINASGNIANDAVGSAQIADDAVKAQHLNNSVQSGNQPIFGVRHFGVCPKGGGACNGSGSLSSSSSNNGIQTISFTSNSPGNDDYTVIATSTDGEGDHALSVTNRGNNNFTIHQSDIQKGGNSSHEDDEAGCMIMVIY